MDFKRYRSPGAAERAKNRIERDVPSARVEVNDDNSLTVYAYTAALSPQEREIVSEHHVRAPAAPSPSTPLLRRLKPRGRQVSEDPSTVDEPCKVAREIFERRFEEGIFADRRAAVAEAVAAGVTPNTAKTIYAMFRADKGLAPRRKRATRKSTIGLRAHGRPSAVKVCNGVSEPGLGTLMREVWDMCDVLHRKLARPPKRGEVAERLTGPSSETIKRAYVAWRTFHAIPPQGQYHKRG